MKLKEKEDVLINELVEIHDVRNKEVLRIAVKTPILVPYLKEILRSALVNTGINIRKRIDLGEDNWLGKEFVFGETLAIIRTQVEITNKNIEDLNIKLQETGFDDVVILSNESNKVNDFRNIVEKYDRCLHKVVLDVKEELYYDMSHSNGRWKQPVLQWNGEIDDERVEGEIRIGVEKIKETESNVYNVLIDAPYGLDVYRMLEQEFGLKKGSLEGYPIESLLIYESVDEKVNHLGRKKCPLYNTSIERTVGGLVGDKCIKAFLADKEATIIKGSLK